MRLAETLDRLKGSRLLTIQDYRYVQPIDGRGSWTKLRSGDELSDYDRNYFPRLKESLGVEAAVVSSVELVEAVEHVEPERAERTAASWISDAKGVVGVTKDDVLQSAALYWAYTALLESHRADAITMSSWALIPDGKLKAMPPLAEMELAKELVPCCCESLIDCLVTLMVGKHLFGRPGFVGDQVSNWPGLRREDALRPPPEHYVAIGHCYGPINPHGDDGVAYSIVPHAYYRLGTWASTDEAGALWRPEDYLAANRQLEAEGITLVGIWVDWPVDEPVTIAKLDPYGRRAQICAGRIFDPHPFFPEFDDTACRTKMAIETETPFVNRLGGHLVAFYGDYSSRFKDLARLLGYQIV